MNCFKSCNKCSATQLGWLRGISKSSTSKTVVHSQARSDRTEFGRDVVIVGSGWAGFGAAWALAKAGANVTVLDAAENPGGLSQVSKTREGRLIEPGIKGFWYQYCNIYSLVQELGIDNPFTPYTESSFYSPQGLEVRSPIFQDQFQLPAPFGNLFHTLGAFTNLPLSDRLTALPLVQALLEYHLDETTYGQYDMMSARELFRSARVSKRLFEQFLQPMLLVTLFAPADQLSAAAALDALYYFVLAHQANFDVRWCKGPIGERIMKPFVRRLEGLGVQVLGSRRVSEMQVDGRGRPCRLTTEHVGGGLRENWEFNAVVFAVGIQAMQRIVQGSPGLAAQPMFAGFFNLSSVDVMAVRLWLDRKISPPTPSNVLAGFDRSWGGTFFDLHALQQQYTAEDHSVVEVDFYNAAALLPLPDEQLIRYTLQELLAVCDPAYGQAGVLDQSVMRLRGAVSLFKPGSWQFMPPVQTSLDNVFMAGDWVRQGPGTHAAKGLCQEKAYVTGLQAGNAAAHRCGLRLAVQVLDAEPDEPHIAFARSALGSTKSMAKLLTPWSVLVKTGEPW